VTPIDPARHFAGIMTSETLAAFGYPLSKPGLADRRGFNPQPIFHQPADFLPSDDHIAQEKT
jgi:hypothetical protein